jgi:hypothetical protein
LATSSKTKLKILCEVIIELVSLQPGWGYFWKVWGIKPREVVLFSFAHLPCFLRWGQKEILGTG